LVLEDSHHGCAAGLAAGSGVVCVPHGREAAAPDGLLFVAACLNDRRIADLLGVALRHEAAWQRIATDRATKQEDGESERCWQRSV
jgi:hypothetical protein